MAQKSKNKVFDTCTLTLAPVTMQPDPLPTYTPTPTHTHARMHTFTKSTGLLDGYQVSGKDGIILIYNQVGVEICLDGKKARK